MERLFKPTVGEVAKHPVAWTLMLVGLLLGTATNQWIKQTDQVNQNAQAENQRLREELKEAKLESKEKDARLIDLYNLMIDEKRRIDSMARHTIGEKGKEIIEKNGGN